MELLCCRGIVRYSLFFQPVVLMRSAKIFSLLSSSLLLPLILARLARKASKFMNIFRILRSTFANEKENEKRNVRFYQLWSIETKSPNRRIHAIFFSFAGYRAVERRTIQRNLAVKRNEIVCPTVVKIVKEPRTTMKGSSRGSRV